jgi:hypothetical protein
MMRQVRMEALKMALDMVPETTNPVQVIQISELFVKYMIEGPTFLQEVAADPPPEAGSRKQRRKAKAA